MTTATLRTRRQSRAARPEPSASGQLGLWLLGAIVLLAAAMAIVHWSRVLPGYDPYGWLVWGYQSIHLHLNLQGAPSWKPLPALFTTPYALAGRDQVWLWMVTEVAVSLAGPIFAARAAMALCRRPGTERVTPGLLRSASVLAAVVAALSVLGLQDYEHYILDAQSDPMITSLCLMALDARLRGRDRTATWLLVLACLGRPEVWPFLAADAVWAWWRGTRSRFSALAGIAIVLLLWYGVPWLTNGNPNEASRHALGSPWSLRDHHKVTGTLQLFLGLQELAPWLAAIVAVAIAIVRRDGRVLAMAAAGVVWVAVEVAFVVHGYAPLARYMYEAAATAAVLAGVGIGWLVIELGSRGVRTARLAAVLCAALMLSGIAVEASARVRAEPQDIRAIRERADGLRSLQAAIDADGGYRLIRSCGKPTTSVAWASALAYLTHLNVGNVSGRLGRELRLGAPIVTFFPRPGGGWEIRPRDTPPAERARCAQLRITVPASGRPQSASEPANR